MSHGNQNGAYKDNLARSRQVAKSRCRVPGAMNPQETDFREETGGGLVTRIVREARWKIRVPHALKSVIRDLWVKDNYSYVLDASGSIVEERPGGRLLVIGFQNKHRVTQGIEGLPLTRAQARSLGKTSFTHVVIDRVPKLSRNEVVPSPDQGYDERGFALRFYAPKSGGQQRGQKGGECVVERHDELEVLQWLFENGLEELFQSAELSGFGVLPKTDEQRRRENVLTAKISMIFGRPWTEPHTQTDFHRVRLLTRLRANFLEPVDENDAEGRSKAEQQALDAYGATRIGQQALAELDEADLGAPSFYRDEAHSVVYAHFSLPGAQYVAVVDRDGQILAVKQIAADLKLLRDIELEAQGASLELSGVPIDLPTPAPFFPSLDAAC